MTMRISVGANQTYRSAHDVVRAFGRSERSKRFRGFLGKQNSPHLLNRKMIMTVIHGTFSGEKPAEVRFAMATYVREVGGPHLQFFTSTPVNQTTGAWSVNLEGGAAYLADWKLTAGRSGTVFLAPAAGTHDINDIAGGAPEETTVTWADVAEKPAVIAAGATQALARSAIGAGTSNVTVAGTGSASTAARSDHTHSDLATNTALNALAARVTALETP